MKFKIILKTPRSIVFELKSEEIYHTEKPYEIYINDQLIKSSNKIVESIYNLEPATSYTLYVKNEDKTSRTLEFTTEKEFVTLNVRDFGAKGDGETDDTSFIQAAILSCPEGGRVLIPKGIYKVTSLFLKSDLVLEIGKDAIISAFTEREKFPILPGVIESTDEKEEYYLGSWEGNPLDTFSSIITGINLSNVTICGEGTVDGEATYDNWWAEPKLKVGGAYRPRILFLNNCKNVVVQGITVQNSPAWTVHPYFSNHLRFLDMKILAPGNSQNTDGLNPESCEDVEIAGCYFSVGDDCIAVKSGKIYMGRKYKVPSKKIRIRQCCMKDGHGAITLGSEIGAGVIDLKVENCLFLSTDRGLRIKTRRGRGEDSIIDKVLFKNIYMNEVKAAFVVNSFYFCDPDGRDEYVSSLEPAPVDERTPRIKNLKFSNINCDNAHYCGAYIRGLPEQKIESVTMENVRINYAPNAESGQAAMMVHCEPSAKIGIYIDNVENVVLDNVKVEGAIGEPITIK